MGPAQRWTAQPFTPSAQVVCVRGTPQLVGTRAIAASAGVSVGMAKETWITLRTTGFFEHLGSAAGLVRTDELLDLVGGCLSESLGRRPTNHYPHVVRPTDRSGVRRRPARRKSQSRITINSSTLAPGLPPTCLYTTAGTALRQHRDQLFWRNLTSNRGWLPRPLDLCRPPCLAPEPRQVRDRPPMRGRMSDSPDYDPVL